MTTKIANGKVIADGKLLVCNVYFENGKITAVTKEDLPCDTVIDASGKYVSAGFIDMHTHGAGGCDFLDNTEEAFFTAARVHAEHGATTIVPTITSGSNESMTNAIKTFDSLKNKPHSGANMPGLHLEGPYFAMSQKGAQDERFVRDFDPEEYEAILSSSDSVLRWSGAPEKNGAKEFGEYLRKKGVLAAIGHSDADSICVREAFENGFTHVTHLYSCTSIVHRKNAFRYAGIVEAAYLIDDMTVEIIGDGIHLPQDLLKLIYKIKGRDHIALITDCMRGAGMGDGESILGGLKDGMKVVIEDGVAKLLDRSAFAGSVCLCDRLVRTVRDLMEIPTEEAVYMATKTPARIMGFDTKGDIKEGLDADIVIFDENIVIDKTIINGITVYEHD